ncbi:hypothetical protein U1Q18_018228, partial [Sarracenia purpurea var. burkii]
MALLFLQNGNLVSGFWIAFMVVLLSRRLGSEPTQDKQALLSFFSQILHANRLQWNSSDSACNWVGVQCNANSSGVYSLRLPAVGLLGSIPANTIGQLTQLRVLSLRSNRLSGQIPLDFSNLKSLRNLYLQNNQFSGEFPASIIDLSRLNRLDLSGNNFTGKIPVAVGNLTQLTGFFLQNNGFTGELPNINGSANLLNFNVSNNHLNGSIPASLSKFPASAFAGNIGLCGEPLPPCSPFGASPAPSPSSIPPPENPSGKRNKKLSTASIVAISVAAALCFILLLLILLLRLRKRQHHRRLAAKPDQKLPATARSAAVAAEAGTSSSKDEVTGGGGGGASSSVEQGERNSLVFFEGGGVYGFDLEDLLRASAEVLGKGGGGTSYKAVLEEEEEYGGTTVVVKRLKDVVVSQKEFESQMEVLGEMKHDNVVPLRAYYYSKDEKLLVYDFMPRGSLSALLH